MPALAFPRTHTHTHTHIYSKRKEERDQLTSRVSILLELFHILTIHSQLKLL